MSGPASSSDIVYKIKSDFLKSLGHPLRLKIIETLKRGEKSVGSLAKHLGAGQSSLSRHLLALRDAGILRSRQEKTSVFYAVRDHDIFLVLRPIAVMLHKKFRESERIFSTLGKE